MHRTGRKRDYHFHAHPEQVCSLNCQDWAIYFHDLLDLPFQANRLILLLCSLWLGLVPDDLVRIEAQQNRDAALLLSVICL